MDRFLNCDQREVPNHFKVKQELHNGMWKNLKILYIHYNQME